MCPDFPKFYKSALNLPGLPLFVTVIPLMDSYFFAGVLFPPLQLTSTFSSLESVLVQFFLDVYVAVVHVNIQLSIFYFILVLYQYNYQETFLGIFLLPKVVYKSHVLLDSAVIFCDDAYVIFEVLKYLLLCFIYILFA